MKRVESSQGAVTTLVAALFVVSANAQDVLYNNGANLIGVDFSFDAANAEFGDQVILDFSNLPAEP